MNIPLECNLVSVWVRNIQKSTKTEDYLYSLHGTAKWRHPYIWQRFQNTFKYLGGKQFTDLEVMIQIGVSGDIIRLLLKLYSY